MKAKPDNLADRIIAKLKANERGCYSDFGWWIAEGTIELKDACRIVRRVVREYEREPTVQNPGQIIPKKRKARR